MFYQHFSKRFLDHNSLALYSFENLSLSLRVSSIKSVSRVQWEISKVKPANPQLGFTPSHLHTIILLVFSLPSNQIIHFPCAENHWKLSWFLNNFVKTHCQVKLSITRWQAETMNSVHPSLISQDIVPGKTHKTLFFQIPYKQENLVNNKLSPRIGFLNNF